MISVSLTLEMKIIKEKSENKSIIKLSIIMEKNYTMNISALELICLNVPLRNY